MPLTIGDAKDAVTSSNVELKLVENFLSSLTNKDPLRELNSAERYQLFPIILAYFQKYRYRYHNWGFKDLCESFFNLGSINGSYEYLGFLTDVVRVHEKTPIGQYLLELICSHPKKHEFVLGIELLQRAGCYSSIFKEFQETVKSNHAVTDNDLFAIWENPIKKLKKPSLSNYEKIIDKLIKEGSEEVLDGVFFALKLYPKLLDTLSIQSRIKLINIAFYNSKMAKKLGRLISLERLELFDGGMSIDLWWQYAEGLISKTCAPATIKSDQEEKLKKISVLRRDSVNLEEIIDGSHFLRMQGRTILFEKEGHILAIKIKKSGESVDQLEKEYTTVSYLKEKSQWLSSKLPTPKCVVRHVENLIPGLRKLLLPSHMGELAKMIDTHELSAYIYSVNKEDRGYFDYVHNPDLTCEAYKKANFVSIRDFCYLLVEEGFVYNQLADIFHLEERKRCSGNDYRYIVLANFLAETGFKSRVGSGRLHAWERSTDFPNIRATGLADFGDWRPLKDFLQNTEFLQENFSYPHISYKNPNNENQNKIGNYVIANLFAELQYILMLNAGRRGKELSRLAKMKGETKENIFFIWQELSKQLIDNCSLIVSLLTKKNEVEIKRFLTSVVDFYRIARQMQFWMTDEYIPYVVSGKIPDDIYGEDTVVSLNMNLIRSGTFTEKNGCSQNGVDQDLGFVNGQEPIKEFNKLLYWMNILIFASYHEHVLIQNDNKAIQSEPNPDNKSKMLDQAFSYLRPKSRYACKLNFWGSENNNASVINVEKDKHNMAAIKIQHRWRLYHFSVEYEKFKTEAIEGATINRTYSSNVNY